MSLISLASRPLLVQSGTRRGGRISRRTNSLFVIGPGDQGWPQRDVDRGSEVDSRGITVYAVADHGHDMAEASVTGFAAWTLVFGNPAAGAKYGTVLPTTAPSLVWVRGET